MGDLFVKLGRSRTARRVIRALRLPLPLPQELRRARGSWQERPLDDLPVIVGHASGGELVSALAGVLPAAGAVTWVVGSRDQFEVYRERGEACGRAAAWLSDREPPEDLRPGCLVFDATGLERPEDLRAVYDFLHPWIRPLRPCGRVVVVSRPSDQTSTPAAAAAARALDGMVRSIGREIGRKGATAQTVYVDGGAEDRLEAVLRFLMSAHSAYVSGQALRISSRASGEAIGLRPGSLEGKVALVTGAGRGIGAATARALAREGAHVLGVDRPAEAESLEKLVGEIGGTSLPSDITDPDAPDTIAEFVKERFAGLDVVVHNAGITRDKTLANMDAHRWEQVLGVNLVAVIALTDALDPLLRRDGRIVCLSSVSGIAGNVGQTNYSASKAGLIGYVQALAPMLAERGITANAVAPGFIETAMTAAIPLMTRQVARRLCNLSQGGLPEDVAEAVAFLSSPGAVGLTGQVLRVCGGSFVGA
ncbi:MAG: 3-oxoacyl-ACP reductase [Phycisphaerae bacterium]|nr:3-oxoacyl-ACP reductase [Phycisphaerae bacterium]